MTPEHRQRIVERHRDALLRHGVHPNALYWSSRKIQEIRFEVLVEIGISSGDRVLDVGCGFGDLKGFLTGRGLEVDYTGIDLSPDLLQSARRLQPQASLVEGDLFDLDPADGSFDWALLSGALNEQLGDDGAYARRLIARMFAAARKGVACNLLDARNRWVAGRPDLQSFQPDDMLDYCRGLGAACELRDGYLDNDFTLHLRRLPPAGTTYP